VNGTNISKVEEIQKIPKSWARLHFKKGFASSYERPLSMKTITDSTGSSKKYQNVHWLMSCLFNERIRDAVSLGAICAKVLGSRSNNSLCFSLQRSPALSEY
jgi:hypothetical protein